MYDREHNATTMKLLLTCPQRNELCVSPRDALLCNFFPSDTLSFVSIPIPHHPPILELKQNYKDLVFSGVQRTARGYY